MFNRSRRRKLATANHHCDPSSPSCDDCLLGTFPLSAAPCGRCVRLVAIEGGRTLRKRLAELGLNPGAEVRVVHRHGGPLILAVKGDARMALGRGMAHQILVEASA